MLSHKSSLTKRPPLFCVEGFDRRAEDSNTSCDLLFRNECLGVLLLFWLQGCTCCFEIDLKQALILIYRQTQGWRIFLYPLSVTSQVATPRMDMTLAELQEMAARQQQQIEAQQQLLASKVHNREEEDERRDGWIQGQEEVKWRRWKHNLEERKKRLKKELFREKGR